VTQRFNLVRCKVCKKVVGADLQIKEVERCSLCHKNKGKKLSSKEGTSNPFSKVRNGPAPDLPKKYRDREDFFRSSWERNFARWLTVRKVDWTFEEFNFPMKINPDTGKWYPRKPWGYLPDFLEVKSGTIWEVKGYFRSADKSKMRRFKKHYPEEFKKLKVCLSKSNKTAQKFYKKLGIPCIFYEDIQQEYKKIIRNSKQKDYWE
jgi:hypothetical protein